MLFSDLDPNMTLMIWPWPFDHEISIPELYTGTCKFKYLNQGTCISFDNQEINPLAERMINKETDYIVNILSYTTKY